MEYQDYLAGKIKVANKKGITIDVNDLHPSTKPHQKAIIKWALQFGAALSDTYAACSAVYLRETEKKREVPTLFDLITETAA